MRNNVMFLIWSLIKAMNSKDIGLMSLIAILFGSAFFLVFNTNTAFGQEKKKLLSFSS